MKPSDREEAIVELLGGSFVSFPYILLEKFSHLGLEPAEFLIVTQILGASQIRHTTDLSAQELAALCGMPLSEVMSYIDRLLKSGFLAIGERLDENGTQCNYYDFRPLWNKIRGKDPKESKVQSWQRNPVTLFEEEFGRPLSGLECEKIRQWLVTDNLPEWLLIEALREAVLASKYSFKYIDRILFDWQRNQIRTRQELEAYQQNYRDRAKARDEIAATKSLVKPESRSKPELLRKEERYSAFYQLFPDS